MTVLPSARPSVDLDVSGREPPLLALRLWTASFAITCLILVCLTGRDGLANLYNRWTHEEEYGYGYLVAALVPFLLWRRWHFIKVASSATRWPGLALVVLGQSCTVLGALGESYFVIQIAFVLSLLGIALVIFGTGAIRELMPLMFLLLLTIPLPYTLQAIITIKLQLLSTDLGVAAMHLIGIPVIAEGNVIDLGIYKLQVAEACSGLRYLLPLTCISFILAYLYKAPLWKKAIVVASAAPITILINSFRIVVVAVLVDSFGIKMADGFIHQFEGWIIFLFGALLLGFEIIVLERFRWSKVEIESILDRPAISEHMIEPIKITGVAIITVLVCVGALGAINSITSAYESTPAPIREKFAEFPREIDGWTGREGQLEQAIVDTLKATDYYVGDFVQAPNRSPVDLFVAYYDSLSKGAAIHSPRVCLPGSGWEFASFEERPFGDLTAGVPGTYTRVVIQKGEEKALMYYWFQQRERRTANEFSMKYYLLVDSLRKSRKDGALVRLYTPIVTAGKKGELEADARLHGFAGAALPRMTSYLPR
jgi:exosortase D (VPLPA-CTERM-specific)